MPPVASFTALPRDMRLPVLGRMFVPVASAANF